MCVNMFEKTDQEIREWFRNEVLAVNPDDDYHRRCEERRQNIERDFAAEWPKKRFKWLFKKRRQNKLYREIDLRYPSPVLWLIEDIINETLPDVTNEFFGQIIEFKETTK